MWYAVVRSLTVNTHDHVLLVVMLQGQDPFQTYKSRVAVLVLVLRSKMNM
jgi:hypothetical protein